ncbi:MAG TPA: peptidoglycan-binding protein [Candidatus Peribacteraceae bacterium]|nr:peptidoglycan-binding protein [Candidatus Peribacteraceae bacterium]
MHIKITSLILVCAMLAPSIAVAKNTAAPYEQDFILTAYYSPVANQCCYIKGSEQADKVLNGGGTRGADGTVVYPGMVAAPPSYAFGTRIDLPGLGVMTVHDRGGAIQQQGNGDRIDVWVGYGEEGLARALAFGVKHIHGTVYPPGTTQPRERFDMTSLPSPVNALKPYLVADAGLLDMHPKSGQTGLSVQMLQETLRTLGYFHGTATGTYGDATQQALASFNTDYGLTENGTELTTTSAAYLLAAAIEAKAPAPVHFINKESPKVDIQGAQRLLRWFGFYKGRTDGVYSDALFSAILKYQQSKKLVGDKTSPGAGLIGPLTRSALITDWQVRETASHAQTFIAYKKVSDLLATRGDLLDSYLVVGQTGETVRAIQQFLADKGFFPADKINGVYGPLTKSSMTQYQIKRGLIASATDRNAGNVGPMTLHQMRTEQIQSMYALVRAKGWGVL